MSTPPGFQSLIERQSEIPAIDAQPCRVTDARASLRIRHATLDRDRKSRFEESSNCSVRIEHEREGLIPTAEDGGVVVTVIPFRFVV